MKNIIEIFFYLLFILIFASCVFDTMYKYEIINLSDKNMIFVVSNSDSLGENYIYLSDRYFRAYDEWKLLIDSSQYCYIKKRSKKVMTYSGTRSELFVNSKDQRARFYFINDSVFMKYPWDTIVTYQMYNRKLTYSKEQLDSMDWIIEYK